MPFGELDGLTLKEIRQDLFRNIISTRQSQDLFDDLSDDPDDWHTAIHLEMAFKPPHYESNQPIIDRPFEEAAYLEAIQFPFDHLGESRFSKGTFGVWYGSEQLETTIHETVYHWKEGFLKDAGFDSLDNVSVERRVHLVHCDGALINLTDKKDSWPELIGNEYGPCQELGRKIHRQGHPGLWTPSARHPGTNAAVFSSDPLTNPRPHCYLTYTLIGGLVEVSRSPGSVILKL